MHLSFRPARLVLFTCFATACTAGASAQTWPGFLGAGRSAIDPATIPLTWSPTSNQAWHAALPGFGQSSPVIWHDRIYVTSVDGPMKDHLIVTALALADGRQLWSKTFPTTDPVENSFFVSRAAPTPVADAGGVYVFFESGDVVALSPGGETRWRRSLAKDYGKFENKYGLGASPVSSGDRLLLLIDHPGPSYVIALAKADGRVLWKTDRSGRGSWSSPTLLPTAHGAQLVCSSGGTIDGYDPATGRLLWTYEGVGGNRICSPTIAGEGAFLIGAQTSREFPDTNSVKLSNFLMRVTLSGETWKPEVVWRTEEAMPAMASPVAAAGCAYWINRTNTLFCFDAATGRPHYTEKLKQTPWATPLLIGDRLYLLGKEGLTTVIAAGPKFQLLAENQLWDPEKVRPDQPAPKKETDAKRKAAMAMRTGAEVFGFAAVSGSLVIRTGSHLYCVREARR
jgi:outer membrane protein assembly factor BamB